MDTQTLILFVIGFGLLLFGAELLVSGASQLATAMGIAPLVVGLTVVAFGTSAPELAISIQSAMNDQADIAVGNIIGSNIANVLLILGIATLILPLVVSKQLIWLDVPLMIATSVLLYVLSLDGLLSRVDGLIMVAGIIGYVVFSIVKSRKENKPDEEEDNADKPNTLLQIVWLVLGLGLLILGSTWLVDGAVMIARHFGLSELVIGLTIIAIGTSLPEVAASVVACLRKQQDLVVGNVVGSNLFNILLVLGATALIAPNGIAVPAAALAFDMPIMMVVAFACLPIFFTGHRIYRWEGILFLFYYIAYLAYLVVSANDHAILPTFSYAMQWFVFPLTGLTFLILLGRDLHFRSKS
jgi:cation:H+ antiporter